MLLKRLARVHQQQQHQLLGATLCHHHLSSSSTTNKTPPSSFTQHHFSAYSTKNQKTEKSSEKSHSSSSEHSDSQSTTAQYYSNRVHQLSQLLDHQSLIQSQSPNHKTLYPNKFHLTRNLEQYIDEYAHQLQPSEKLLHVTERITGRILSIRKSSQKLLFVTLRNGDATFKVQVMLMHKFYHSGEEFDLLSLNLKRGDHIGVIGHPCKTGTGELSILPRQLVLLSPCLHVLPDAFSSTSLLDPEVRYRNRALDFVVHHESLVPHFQTRSNILSFFRIFLASRDFVEVETPILSLQSGGAAARPFVTQLNSMGGDVELKLRIAPELYLKELVIGGMERVFELGKVFRNEGVDATHNPEFTSCELYMAHADYRDLMTFTEELFRGCALFLHELKTRGKKLYGSGVIETALKISSMVASSNHGDVDAGSDGEAGVIEYTVEAGSKVAAQTIKIDLKQPFRRISYLDSIEEEIGEKIGRGDALNTPETVQQLTLACQRHKIDLDRKRSGDVSYLLDRLLSHLVEPKCIQPTFICDHPTIISPLAKSHESDASITERFELFIAGRELCNAYTELNDPVEQRRRFEQQVKAKEDHGDVEAHEKDENFCRSLEYGLPPTGGWGCGIDRLVMLLTNSWNIRDVLLFPMMKPKEHTTQPVKEAATTN